jgi:hypothetical protein
MGASWRKKLLCLGYVRFALFSSPGASQVVMLLWLWILETALGKRSHKNEDPVPVFFFPILWCCHIGDDAQGDLAKFGYRLAMKKGHIQQILFEKIFRHLLATKNKNVVLFKFGFSIIIRSYQFFCLLIYVNFYHSSGNCSLKCGRKGVQ